MEPVEFRVERERIGLAQGDVSSVLGVDARTVTRWESGRSAMPDYAADAMEELGRKFDAAVEGMLKVAAANPSDAVVIQYYRMQVTYDRTHNDGGRIGMVNAVSREVARALRAEGRTVRFVYAEDA